MPTLPSSQHTFNALLDQKRLIELYADDKEYAADMFQTFLNDVLPDFQQFEQLIKQQDWNGLGVHAHKLKPTLGMVGLSKLEEQMQEIEKLAKTNENVDSLPSKWNDLRLNLEQMLPVLKNELEALIK